MCQGQTTTLPTLIRIHCIRCAVYSSLPSLRTSDGCPVSFLTLGVCTTTSSVFLLLNLCSRDGTQVINFAQCCDLLTISLALSLAVVVCQLIIYPVYNQLLCFLSASKMQVKHLVAFFCTLVSGLNHCFCYYYQFFFPLSGSEDFRLKRRPCSKKMPMKQRKKWWEKTEPKTYNVDTHTHTPHHAIWLLWSL